jgi:hypothetical protein
MPKRGIQDAQHSTKQSSNQNLDKEQNPKTETNILYRSLAYPATSPSNFECPSQQFLNWISINRLATDVCYRCIVIGVRQYIEQRHGCQWPDHDFGPEQINDYLFLVAVSMPPDPTWCCRFISEILAKEVTHCCTKAGSTLWGKFRMSTLTYDNTNPIRSSRVISTTHCRSSREKASFIETCTASELLIAMEAGVTSPRSMRLY